MNDLQNLMDDVQEWSDETFGEGYNRTLPLLYHLKEEVPELIEAIKDLIDELSDGADEQLVEEASQKVWEEFADCFMLLTDAAAHFGLTADDLIEASREKLLINKNSEWGRPDANGVRHRIK